MLCSQKHNIILQSAQNYLTIKSAEQKVKVQHTYI